MTNIQKEKRLSRNRRHARIRAKISGTAERPRVSVFKSSKGLRVQAVDDTVRKTVVSSTDTASKKKVTVPDEFKAWGVKTRRAFVAGELLAEGLKKRGIEKAVFDAGGYKYHGRVKAVAEGLRHGGIVV